MKSCLLLLLAVISLQLCAQKENPANDPEAGALLQKVSEKYKAYKNIQASFLIFVQRPKLKPEDDDRKNIDTLKGQITLQQDKFKVSVADQQIVCDGKNIWTFAKSDKEVQLNTYEEGDDIFSPAKIFMLYKAGYLYTIREKVIVNGRHLTILEMAPPNKKVTYFKIDITVDDESLQLVESKIFEKNGSRYIYKLVKQTPNVATTDDNFVWDAKKHPGVKVVDLR
jgi:outer membrane lipoprotein carrier protein